jgi:hypothetical protein
MAFSLSRNANLFVSTVDANADPSGNPLTVNNTWEIKVLDGFSFSAAVDTQEIEISEAGDTPTRGQQVFTTAIQPAEWSFQAYIRPRYDVNDDRNDAVERILWEALASNDTTITTDTSGTATTLLSNANGGMTVDFQSSNTNELKQLYFYWNLGTVASPVWYYMPGVVVNQAEIDFSIDAIASITWSGFADEVKQIISGDNAFTHLNEMLNGTQGDLSDTSFPDGSDGYLAAPTGQQACIRNKLSTVTLIPDSGQGVLDASEYFIALTGGSLTINNNITFLTPEALGVVNQPCGHFTGQLQVSGNMTAYLKSGDTGDTAELLKDLLDYSTGTGASADPTRFALTINVGGSTPSSPWNTPIAQFSLPAAHLVVPTINIEDVVSVDIPFTGLSYDSTGTVPAPQLGNEITVAYYTDET